MIDLELRKNGKYTTVTMKVNDLVVIDGQCWTDEEVSTLAGELRREVEYIEEYVE